MGGRVGWNVARSHAGCAGCLKKDSRHSLKAVPCRGMCSVAAAQWGVAKEPPALGPTKARQRRALAPHPCRPVTWRLGQAAWPL